MKIAIMQPYLFPYIGYFQLINNVDCFVIYDDVNYIKKGWINRNNLLINNEKYLFTLPLREASQNKKINQIYLFHDKKWISNFLKTIELGYKKEKMFSVIFPLIEDGVYCEELNLSKFIVKQLCWICKYLEIKTTIINSSEKYLNNSLSGVDRIIDICKKENASIYVNPIGGLHLYESTIFINNDLQLQFINQNEFILESCGLFSIIDVLMKYTKNEIINLLNNYSIIEK